MIYSHIFKKQNRGFTLIELLVVVAIIGILSTVSLISLNSVRGRGRDAKRITELKEIQKALLLYYTDNNKYPVEPYGIFLGSSPDPSFGTPYICLTNNGFKKTTCSSNSIIYMNPLPIEPFVNNPVYYYQYTSNNNGDTYGIDFALEVGNKNIVAGPNCLTPENIIAGSCIGENP